MSIASNMYQPSKKVLERYADVIVNFALGHGKGIRKGEVVHITAYESAKPFYIALLSAITKAGGHVIPDYRPDDDRSLGIGKVFFENAKDHQLDFFPAKYYRGLVDEMAHYIFVESEADLEVLTGVDPKKIMARSRAMKPYREWRAAKENRGDFSWTIALYGTRAMAREAGLTEREYWDQIVKACFLNDPHPIDRWRAVEREIAVCKDWLNKLSIKKLHVTGPDADLWITLGEKRVWDTGGGANIPSFEVFTSPDWRGTEGWIRFNQPLYADGHMVRGVALRFKGGRVIEARASRNEKLLKSLVQAPNADKIGEFSLTDRRFSKITKFMATTLYDENIGGPNGNTHLAIGSAFQGCYDGDTNKLAKKDWAKLGFNDSPIHKDIISTAPRTVVAYLANRKEMVIYKNGMFIVPRH